MKGTIIIHFEKINNFTVNEELLKLEPKLLKVTEHTLKEVCRNLEKYFKEKKIKIKYEFKVEE